MKIALFLVLSLSALALAGPAFNKNNQIQQQQQQDAIANKQQQYMTAEDSKSPAINILKQWCFSSQMSQQELTASFKKLVSVIESNPIDTITESAVMGERICQGALVAKSQTTGETVGQGQADVKAHELIKDVYMDAMISCKSHECTQQLLKIVQSQQVDAIRAAYYMTRIAVSDKQEIKDAQEIKTIAESFLSKQQQHGQQGQSEVVERQQLFATTALIGKWIAQKPTSGERQQIEQVAEQVAKAIVERFVAPIGQQEVEQYKKAEAGELSPELAKKMAKRSAAIKALANIPGHVLKQCREVEQQLVQIAQNTQELSTVRQSAIECLQQNDKQIELLKAITFDQQEPIEVRVAAYRALMTSMYVPIGERQQQQQQQQQQKTIAEQIVAQLVKHCEQQQQQDEQFVLYVVSHLDNVRTSQQPEIAAIKEIVVENKQHFMQIQLLAKKLRAQLSDVRRSSRNYKLEQEFAQLSSGLVLEGDIVYESRAKKAMTGEILPKLVRVNMSMPVMGETVNVLEITVRQDNMDAELLGALKLVQGAKFNHEVVSKVVDSFKESAERQQAAQQSGKVAKQAEADLTIKCEGRTIIYVCLEDFKYGTTATKYSQQQQQQHQRNTRSVYGGASIMDEIIEYLKRQPLTFNRGFNFNIQERIAKVLDVDVNAIAGMRFESRAQGSSKKDFEIVAQMEPRFSFEAIVGPAKLSAKKLLQRFSTKSALGLRLRFKENELVDVELELPMSTMELFTFESQLVEKKTHNSYAYLPESIYGQEDIYASYPIYSSPDFYTTQASKYIAKRSIVPSFGVKKQQSIYAQVAKSIGLSTGGKHGVAFSHVFESPKRVERATGLVGKLRVVASPSDMSALVSCVIEKQESQMRGLRVKVEQTGGRTSGDVKTYALTFMTPGSSVDRTMQVRLSKQGSQARTLVKAEIEGPQMAALFSTELIHDGRQFSVKSEIVSRAAKQQWRHALECGLLTGPQTSSSGRLAHFNYKPFLQIDSSALKRPIVMQGQIAYVQSPKSVISYELKCPTTGDFVQGKLIFDARDNKMSQQMRKRSGAMSFRRSMTSPLELIASQDVTFTSEFVAQIAQHVVKAHQMIDWDCQKYALQGNSLVSYKDARKQQQQQQPGELIASMKVDAEQQIFSVERKCPTDARKQWVARLVSSVRPSGHQMELECRYHTADKRASQQQQQTAIVAYKHKLDVQKIASNKYECSLELELVDTERQIGEKLAGRARLSTERKQKQCQLELSGSRNKSCKLSVDFESLAKHQIAIVFNTERIAHKCEVRNNERQFTVASRTESLASKETLAKLMVDIEKQSGPIDCKVAFEIPSKRVNVGADVKLAAGKRSSIAIQTGRFVGQTEFSFDLKSVVGAGKSASSASQFARLYPFERAANVRVRSNLKDLANKQAYWMESALNGADLSEPSFLRFQSPFYSSELEFSPRDQQAKLAAFARNSRPAYQQQLDSIYRQDASQKSLLEQLNSLAQEKLSLGPSKMWMVRSIVASPFARDQLKKQARRALFEYADRSQAHRHSLSYSPSEERISMELAREPNSEFGSQSGSKLFSPLRLKADLSTELSRPSSVSLDSEWMSADVEAKPFGHYADDDDNQESYAKVSALSRHPRSTFKQHESELRYSKKGGYKAHMKHRDARDKRSEVRAEADAQPSKWTKLAFESEKHGNAQWEHKWRQQQQQRKRSGDQENVFANSMWLKREGPQKAWQHESKFEWEEPTRMIAGGERRYRRSIFDDDAETARTRNLIFNSNKLAKLASQIYYPVEYLQQTSGRLATTYDDMTTGADGKQQQYKLDFDYAPHANFASMNVQMPQEMSHLSSLEFKPSERLYKLQSKLYNRRTSEPTYELLATSKPSAAMMGGAEYAVDKLATGEQEPVFVHSTHPMLERPISSQSLVYKLLRQPMKLDYSDKYGRVANFDYDQLAVAALDAKVQQQQQQQQQQFRQKRAAFFYKDPTSNFEHSSSYDFYPETFMTKIKPSYYNTQADKVSTIGTGTYNMAPVALKTHTKYGPVVVRADSSASGAFFELVTPIMNAKIVGETGANMRTLYKVQLDNKSQRVQLAKLLREAPESVRDCKLVKKFARKFDSEKFEHQCELLVSLVDQIFKIKSSTKLNERPMLEIEGEWNEQTDKAYATINGERINGQVIVDLVRKSADLSLSLDDKRTWHHVTRLAKTSDKFYALESMTVHKGRPVFKLAGKVAAKVFDLEHLLATPATYERRHSSSYEPSEHLSTFEAVVYEPKELHVSGQFDCDKKEARIVIKNLEEQKVQETELRFEPQSETISMISQLTSKHEGQIYSTKAKINLAGLYQSSKCARAANKDKYMNKYISKYAAAATGAIMNDETCKSEIVYSDNKSSGVWAAQYYPGQFLSVSSPRGQSTFNLAY